MKKFLAVLSVVGVATLITGCSDNMNINTNNYVKNINDFKEQVSAYSKINSNENTKVILGKYKLSTSPENKLLDAENSNKLNKSKTINETAASNGNDKLESNSNLEKDLKNDNKENIDNNLDNINSTAEDLQKPLIGVEENVNISKTALNLDTDTKTDAKNEKLNEQISTLYSLSTDINDCCENFTTLKQNLTDAIVETQNLIEKVNSKEIELTNEQRLLIIEQSKQLKDLARKLSTITTELSISLTDLNNLMVNDGSLDSLSLKYLIVLDNLVNGNEMLENGLHSLNLINNLFNSTAPLPPNNTGRILYGFRRNNEAPIIKDYYFDENGNLVENEQNKTEDLNLSDNVKTENNENDQKNEANVKSSKNDKKNIDTMQNNMNTNIDGYRNHNQNIDSFFNTALLDNEFMYGNGYENGLGAGMGNGLVYGNMINENVPSQNGRNVPNNQYAQNNNFNNTTNGVNNNQSTQQNENNNAQQNNLKKKKFKFKNNIDTYKDANTPTLATRFGKVKKSISGFFNKLSSKKEDIIYNKINKGN